MFTPILRLLFLLLFLIFPGGANTVLHAEETPDMDDCSLYIESKTDVASAQCMIDGVTAQDSCDMRDRLLRYFATCGQEKPLSGSLKRGEKNA